MTKGCSLCDNFDDVAAYVGGNGIPEVKLHTFFASDMTKSPQSISQYAGHNSQQRFNEFVETIHGQWHAALAKVAHGPSISENLVKVKEVKDKVRGAQVLKARAAATMFAKKKHARTIQLK